MNSMRVVKTAAILGGIIILVSCASQPKPAPQEDPRVGQLQGQVDDLQKQVAAKDAELRSLSAKVDALNKTNSDLSANLESLRSGSTKGQADYLAQINALN